MSIWKLSYVLILFILITSTNFNFKNIFLCFFNENLKYKKQYIEAQNLIPKKNDNGLFFSSLFFTSLVFITKVICIFFLNTSKLIQNSNVINQYLISNK